MKSQNKKLTPKGNNKMANNNKFYICEKCGNIVEMVNASGVTPHCCGQKMSVLEAGVVEASREKHIPEVSVSDNEVKVVVGSVLHPMAEEHSILWVYLETDKGIQRKALEVGKAPRAIFNLADGEKPIAAYAYCNLHGLWKTDIQ
jgi:superoxide reductase